MGVNKYVDSSENPIPTLRIEPEVERGQVALIKELKATRDAEAAALALAAVREACAGEANLMYPLVEAVRAEVTLGEICDVFREELGVYKDPAFV